MEQPLLMESVKKWAARMWLQTGTLPKAPGNQFEQLGDFWSEHGGGREREREREGGGEEGGCGVWGGCGEREGEGVLK